MAKERKRKNNSHKRKQLLSKRSWLLHRPTKSKVNGKLNAKARTTKPKANHRERRLVNLPAKSVCSAPETQQTGDSRKADSFMRCFILSLSYTASSPIGLFCACMSMCCCGFKKGLMAMSKGKERVHTTLSSSLFNGYTQLQKVFF